jgi:hypothetical protein
MKLRTISDYDMSARDTLRNGTRFTYTYVDRRTPQLEEPRIGYYDRRKGLFTAVTDDDAVILSHFETSERYVRNLQDSTYA